MESLSQPHTAAVPPQALRTAQPTGGEQVLLERLQGTRCRRFAARRPVTFRPALEGLEERVVPYALSGFKWPNPAISASIMPDGTALGGSESNLHATYDARYATETWQREVARALQTWAAVTPLNFHFVADSGESQGAYGLVQGDGRFGDIRLGAFTSESSYAAYGYYPNLTSTKGGDIHLNTSRTFNIGTTTDLYSVLVHEVGHALGVGHSKVYGSVMYSSVTRVHPGLTTDDLTAIRALYGARRPDAFDARAANNTMLTPTVIRVNASTGGLSLTADLTTAADIDFYRLTVPAGSNGTLTLSVDASNRSLLSPRLSVFNAARRLVTTTYADYGSTATLTLRGLLPGRTYFLAADGLVGSPFQVGSYQLNVQFGGFAASMPATTTTATTTGGTSTADALPGGAALLDDPEYLGQDETEAWHRHDHTCGDGRPWVAEASAAAGPAAAASPGLIPPAWVAWFGAPGGKESGPREVPPAASVSPDRLFILAPPLSLRTSQALLGRVASAVSPPGAVETAAEVEQLGDPADQADAVWTSFEKPLAPW